MTADTAAEVRRLVADLLPVLAPHAMLDGESGLLVLPVGAAHARVSLDSVTAACAPLPRHAWPGQIERWLRSVTARVAGTLAERDTVAGDVEDLLRVQVVPRLTGPERQELVCVPFTDHLDVVVVLDGPGGGRLHRERAARLSVADAGTRALTNTLRRELPTFAVTDRPLTATDRVRVISKDANPYVTSALLELGRFLPDPAPGGALVGLPQHSAVLVYPVRTRRVHRAAGAMAELVGELHRSAPDPCGTGLYWWTREHLYAVRLRRGRPRTPGPLRRIVRSLPAG